MRRKPVLFGTVALIGTLGVPAFAGHYVRDNAKKVFNTVTASCSSNAAPPPGGSVIDEKFGPPTADADDIYGFKILKSTCVFNWSEDFAGDNPVAPTATHKYTQSFDNHASRTSYAGEAYVQSTLDPNLTSRNIAATGLPPNGVLTRDDVFVSSTGQVPVYWFAGAQITVEAQLKAKTHTVARANNPNTASASSTIYIQTTDLTIP